MYEGSALACPIIHLLMKLGLSHVLNLEEKLHEVELQLIHEIWGLFILAQEFENYVYGFKIFKDLKYSYSFCM